MWSIKISKILANYFRIAHQSGGKADIFSCLWEFSSSQLEKSCNDRLAN